MLKSSRNTFIRNKQKLIGLIYLKSQTAIQIKFTKCLIKPLEIGMIVHDKICASVFDINLHSFEKKRLKFLRKKKKLST